MNIRPGYKNLIGILILTTLSNTSSAENYPVAGVSPSKRPSDAPVKEWVQHNQAWFKQALTGVETPYPKSLYFLDNQGNWYTPFTKPGMTGRYDQRDWHQ